VQTAIQAQMEIEEMAKMEEKGGDDWTDEKRAEYEKRVTGKILAAAWRGSKYEVQGVLRDVCDNVLYDKKVKTEKRIERAHALVVIGELFAKVCCDFDSLLKLYIILTYIPGRKRSRRRRRLHGIRAAHGRSHGKEGERDQAQAQGRQVQAQQGEGGCREGAGREADHHCMNDWPVLKPFFLLLSIFVKHFMLTIVDSLRECLTLQAI
jgi:hypothetical protein